MAKLIESQPDRKNRKAFSPSPRQALKQIGRLERAVNNWEMIPAMADPRGTVFLCLYSKALTLGRAICALVEKGFYTEAFGLSRTLTEIFLSLRYMSNNGEDEDDTAADRIASFVDYVTRVQKEWFELNKKYLNNPDVKSLKTDEEMVRIAAKFKSRHKWTLYGASVKTMAYELDSFEKDDAGNPITAAVDYDVFYFWTSHYVHATCSGLDGHLGERGETFRIRARPSRELRYGRLALVNVVTGLTKISIQVCRGIREEQPEAILQDMLKMMEEPPASPEKP